MNIENKIAQALAKKIDDAIFSETTEPWEAGTFTPEKLRTMLSDAKKFIRQAKRTSVTFVVEHPRDGPITTYEKPGEGSFFEMSWRQAQELHRVWPMVLGEVIDENTAHFRPAHRFDPFVPKRLPLPPYTVEQDDSDDRI